MIQLVTSLNKAAFLIMKGATLVGFDGKYWYNCKIVIDISGFLYKEIKDAGDYSIKDYRKYMEERTKIKLRIKKVYNVL